MIRILKILVSTAAAVALAVGPALAQTAPSPMPPLAPGASGAPGAESMPKEKQVEGPVKLVDPATKTVKVGWFLRSGGSSVSCVPHWT